MWVLTWLAFDPKWWWPIFRYCIDLSVNNAHQLYRHQTQSTGEKKFDLLGFRCSIVDTYQRRYRKSSIVSIFLGNRKSIKVSDDVQFDVGHWIGKGNQRKCGGCPKTTAYFCEKCDIASWMLQRFSSQVTFLWSYNYLLIWKMNTFRISSKERPLPEKNTCLDLAPLFFFFLN